MKSQQPHPQRTNSSPVSFLAAFAVAIALTAGQDSVAAESRVQPELGFKRVYGEFAREGCTGLHDKRSTDCL